MAVAVFMRINFANCPANLLQMYLAKLSNGLYAVGYADFSMARLKIS